jgi:hypothetical protein
VTPLNAVNALTAVAMAFALLPAASAGVLLTVPFPEIVRVCGPSNPFRAVNTLAAVLNGPVVAAPAVVMAGPVLDDATLLLPISVASALGTLTPMVWLALGPTWNCCVE